MHAGLNPSHMGQCGNQTDGAVPAHTKIADIVEKDHSGDTRGITRWTQQSTDNDIRTARLVYAGRAKSVMLGSHLFQASRYQAFTQLRPAFDDDPRGFTTRVGIYHPHSFLFRMCHEGF